MITLDELKDQDVIKMIISNGCKHKMTDSDLNIIINDLYALFEIQGKL